MKIAEKNCAKSKKTCYNQIMKSGLYKIVLTLIPEGVLILDLDFNIIFANDRFKQLLKKDQIEGKINDFIENYTYETSEKDYIIKKFDTIVDDEKIAIKVCPEYFNQTPVENSQSKFAKKF